MEDKVQNSIERLRHEDADIRTQAADDLVAIGPTIIPKILPLLESQEWQIRFRSGDILGRVGVRDKSTYEKLEQILADEKDSYVEEKLIFALQSSVIEAAGEFPDKDLAPEKIKEISWFSQEEATDLREILSKNDIVFGERVLKKGYHKLPDTYGEAFAFHVEESKFDPTIEFIQDYFGFNEQSFTGNCPACDTYSENVEVCPDCELSLSRDILVDLDGHPFLAFLGKQGLLGEEESDED